jgi:hypothetical protein
MKCVIFTIEKGTISLLADYSECYTIKDLLRSACKHAVETYSDELDYKLSFSVVRYLRENFRGEFGSVPVSCRAFFALLDVIEKLLLQGQVVVYSETYSRR